MKLAVLNQKPEVFYTIQGEGKNVGSPAVFCRLSLCNLHCTWCDTPYTWNWEGTPWPHDDEIKFDRKKEIVVLTPADVAKAIIEADTGNCRHVVFTGGEPMIQQDELVEVMTILRASDKTYFFEVETNGTKAYTGAFDRLIDQYNVSPKLASSGNSEQIRDKRGPMGMLAWNPKVYFKFVVTDEPDLDEIIGLVEKYGIKASRVFLMPEGRTAQEIVEKELLIVEICKTFGWNFSTRLHVLLWGALKGV